jgi:hypothetical protein
MPTMDSSRDTAATTIALDSPPSAARYDFWKIFRSRASAGPGCRSWRWCPVAAWATGSIRYSPIRGNPLAAADARSDGLLRCVRCARWPRVPVRGERALAVDLTAQSMVSTARMWASTGRGESTPALEAGCSPRSPQGRGESDLKTAAIS